MENYLALLRGINVGGNNVIKMSDLKDSFERIGFWNVLTYIQSGNVIFWSKEKNIKYLTDKIEKELSVRFTYNSKVVLIPYSQLEQIVKEVPAGFGIQPDKYRYDVMFLRDNVVPKDLIKNLKIKEGVDTADAGRYALYFSRLISKAAQSQLKNIFYLREYQSMTIRNWNTTIKLFDLMNNQSNN